MEKKRKRLKLQLTHVVDETITHGSKQKLLSVCTHSWVEKPSRPARQVQPVVLVVGRKLEPTELAAHVIALAQIAPNGFRQPSSKPHRTDSTSLVEQVSIRAKMIDKPVFEYSKRGQKKAEARTEANARIVLDRLIEQCPALAEQACNSDRLRNWFVGCVEEQLAGTVDREWLATLVQQRIKDGLDPKYQHAAARKRLHDKVLAA